MITTNLQNEKQLFTYTEILEYGHRTISEIYMLSHALDESSSCCGCTVRALSVKLAEFCLKLSFYDQEHDELDCTTTDNLKDLSMAFFLSFEKEIDQQERNALICHLISTYIECFDTFIRTDVEVFCEFFGCLLESLYLFKNNFIKLTTKKDE